MTKAIAAACRGRGYDVRVVTPDDGLGEFPGTIAAVAGQVVIWQHDGWAADVFCELHTNWLPHLRQRGAFAIYPDATGDIGAGVRDRLGPELVKRVAAATGLPVWGDGILSERRTAVGIGGSRLALFTCSNGLSGQRLILECGHHSSPEDLELLRSPGTFDLIGEAFADWLDWWLDGA